MKRSTLYKIISAIIFLPALISMILWVIGWLDIMYMVITNWIVFIAETIMFLIIVRTVIKGSINENAVVIPKVSLTDKYIISDKEILNSYIRPTNLLNDSIFRIKLEVKDNVNPLLSIIRKCSADTCEQVLNKDIIIDTGKVHMFETAIDRREILNFKFDKNVDIKLFSIEELYIP